MNADDKTAHLKVYTEMAELYFQRGQPEKAEKYLRLIQLVTDEPLIINRVVKRDGNPAKARDVELYCKLPPKRPINDPC